MPVAIPRVGYGLLNAIAGPESGGVYNRVYGGGSFSDFGQHPNIAVPIQNGPNAGQTSTAAGKYQFLNSTWNEIAKQNGLTDFSPQSQDQGAWALAQRDYKARTGGDLTQALEGGDLQGVSKALSPTWTSLSGGIEAQPGGTGAQLAAAYQNGLQGQQADKADNATAVNAVDASAPTQLPGGLLADQATAVPAPTDPTKTGLLAPQQPAAKPEQEAAPFSQLGLLAQPRAFPKLSLNRPMRGLA